VSGVAQELKRGLIAGLALFAAMLPAAPAWAKPAAGRNLVLVTIDGVRWHEIFEGASPTIVADKRFVDPDIRHDVIAPAFLDVPDRATALMPFLHQVMARQGVLYGDPRAQQCARVSNAYAVSYPGYSEFLTGRVDPAIANNDPIDNPKVSFLEYLNRLPGFRGRVGVAGNWDIFPHILNVKRSHLPVNVGFAGQYPSEVRVEREGFRLLKAHKRVIYVALGDTDEYAHAGDYAFVLAALERTDEMLRRIWETVQADPFYRGRTTLLVTTDHGRGDAAADDWREHGTLAYFQKYPDDGPSYTTTGIPASAKVWFAALGPAVVARRHMPKDCATSAQIAASGLRAVGVDWRGLGKDIAPPLWFIGK